MLGRGIPQKNRELANLFSGAFTHNPISGLQLLAPAQAVHARKKPRVSEAVAVDRRDQRRDQEEQEEEEDVLNQLRVPAVAGDSAQVTASLALERQRSAQLEDELAQAKAACAKLEKTLNSRMSQLKYVSGRVPRANLASVLHNMLPAELISSFLGIREVLRLKTANKSLAKILTGRPELFRDADVYQFNSRYPERCALQLCDVLLLERAALRNLRLLFSADEWCVPRSLLLACNLNSLETLSLKRRGDYRVLRNGFISSLTRVVDLTRAPDPEPTRKYDLIISKIYHASASSTRSVLEALTCCKNLRSIDIPLSDELIRAKDLHILESMPFLSSLELCLEEEIYLMDSTPNGLDPFQVKSLFSTLFAAIKSMKALKTFVLRDGEKRGSSARGFDSYRDFCHPGLMVLESSSLEIADFSKMDKGFKMGGLKCPKLKRLVGVGSIFFSAFCSKFELRSNDTIFNPSGVNYQAENHVFGSVWLSYDQGWDYFRLFPVILPRDCVVEGRGY